MVKQRIEYLRRQRTDDERIFILSDKLGGVHVVIHVVRIDSDKNAADVRLGGVVGGAARMRLCAGW